MKKQLAFVWGFWSAKLAVLGSLLAALLQAFPDAALHAWLILPQEIKQMIPPQYMPLIGVAIFATATLKGLFTVKKEVSKNELGKSD